MRVFDLLSRLFSCLIASLLLVGMLSNPWPFWQAFLVVFCLVLGIDVFCDDVLRRWKHRS